ncbi:hypothetical protein D3C78_976090 [compost metagenome]
MTYLPLAVARQGQLAQSGQGDGQLQRLGRGELIAILDLDLQLVATLGDAEQRQQVLLPSDAQPRLVTGQDPYGRRHHGRDPVYLAERLPLFDDGSRPHHLGILLPAAPTQQPQDQCHPHHPCHATFLVVIGHIPCHGLSKWQTPCHIINHMIYINIYGSLGMLTDKQRVI